MGHGYLCSVPIKRGDDSTAFLASRHRVSVSSRDPSHGMYRVSPFTFPSRWHHGVVRSDKVFPLRTEKQLLLRALAIRFLVGDSQQRWGSKCIDVREKLKARDRDEHAVGLSLFLPGISVEKFALRWSLEIGLLEG